MRKVLLIGAAIASTALTSCNSVSVPMPQAKKGSTAVIGQRATAGVGDPILAEFDYFYRAGAVPDASVEAKSAEWTMRVPAGTPLMEVSMRDQKWFCTTFFAAYNLMGIPGANACLRDSKGDGHFARRTAILQLQWQPNTTGGWVDLDRGVIDFKGGARRTKKRRAAIPIPDRLLTFLRYARRRTKQYVIEFEGEPIRDPKKALGTAGRAAGLGSVFSHLLKHSAVTYLVKCGVPLWHVSEWTGTSVKTLQRHYGHHAPDYLNKVREALR